MKNAKLLVVDDDEVDRMAVRRALKGRNLIEASDAASAVAILQKGPVDLVLLDYFVPPDTGPEVLKKLLAVQPDLPCIFLSGKGSEEIAVESMKAGAEDYLPKSVVSEPDRLRHLVDHTLVSAQLRAQVHRERARCALALEASGAGTWSVEAEDVTGDETFRRLFSLPEGTTWPVSLWLTCFVPADAQRMDAALRERSVSHQVRLVGEPPRWVEVRGRREGRKDFIGTVMDITPAKSAETQRLAMKDRLVGIASHDLKNPLSAVTMGALLLSKSNGLAENERRLVEHISTSAKRMSSLIAQLLDLTRVRLAGGIPVERKEVALHELIPTLVEQTRLGSGRTFETKLTPVTVQADPDRLSQVLSNLLDNAVKHGSPDEPIRVTLSTSGSRTFIDVANNSPAIAPAVLETLFEPFTQGLGATREGMGLGLFISREVMRAHGGSLTATSTQGVTRFRAEL